MEAIPKAYEPGLVEDRWYEEWERRGCFAAGVDNAKPAFTILIPPPNVTGVLTMGHVLNNTLQDLLIRRARQSGFSALWLPGTDHAGIATQTRVEKSLREQGKTRRELGREAFLKQACEWRDRHGGIILKQLRKLGASCDWSRTVHTLDADYSHAVCKAFVELFHRGYVYRGKRMVNWCPVSLTALSDEEVTMKPQVGKLYHMRYEIVEEPGRYLEIATTRPETIMGDSGVAVHPEDERYADLVGKHVWRPFPKKAIPIIADRAVEKDFGTGVLKVTPAHDPVDFEIGTRNELEVIEVIDADGRLNALAGEPFVGMDRFEARKVAAAKLAELGLLVKEEIYENNVGYSERADVPIEPRLSEQWFLRYPKVEEAKLAVRKGLIAFHPTRWEKTYLHWLDNIRDWCISRQLWWGHRIPVWYRKGVDRSNPENWHVSIEGPEDSENWEQDEDVLDTWASSWLWPLATLGWPDGEEAQKRGLSYFFPTSTLVTGPDIIFFWVARMIVACLEFAGEETKKLEIEEIARRIPFRDVYFTGIIRDAEGRKMSKSLGNSPDPLDLIEKFGADGLRFGILSIAPQGQDIRFDSDRVEQGRFFCNKLWNACRLRQLSGESDGVVDSSSTEAILKRVKVAELTVDDVAILMKVVRLTETVESALGQYQFITMVQALYGFFWNDFCDWYLEVSKARMRSPSGSRTVLAVQDFVLRQYLMLLHPVTPFITEELWHLLGYGEPDTFIQDTTIPRFDELNVALVAAGIELSERALEEVEQVRETVSQLRALKADFQLSANRGVSFGLKAEREVQGMVDRQRETICAMVGATSIDPMDTELVGPTVVTPLGTFILNMAESMDVEAESERLSKELGILHGHIEGTRKRLSNRSFIDRAPAAVVEGAKKQLEELETKAKEIERVLQSISE